MNKYDVENKVKESFDKVTPDSFSAVREAVEGRTVNRTVPAASSRRGNMFWKLATCCLALILVAVAVAGGIGLTNEYASASTISLDVNPSVQITLSRNKKVVKVEALNDDGKIIIGNMDFKGCQLEVCVNALIGSMLRNDYLTTETNSVLVSVDSNKKDYKTLADIVANEIAITLNEMDIEASVVSQWLIAGDEVSAIAKNNNISLGKAQLIYKIAGNSDYTVEQLVDLSVNELSLLLSELNISDNDLTHSGTVSQIGEEAALQKALDTLNVEGLTVANAEANGVKIRKHKLDYDNGVMVYEAEFVYDGYDYDVEIGAVSGAILSYGKQLITYNPDNVGDKLTQAEVKALVFANANVEEADVTNLFEAASRYYRNEAYVFCFNANGMYYEYEADCYGAMLYVSYEKVDLGGEDSYLTRKELLSWFIENNKDGFTHLDELERYRVTTSATNDGITYTMQFVSDGNQYTYEVDGVNRTIQLKEVVSYEEAVKDSVKDKLHDFYDFDDDFFKEFDKFWDEWEEEDNRDFEYGGYHFEFDRWGNMYDRDPFAPPRPHNAPYVW